MQIAWSELLFSEMYNGQSNKPFEKFLENTTRVASVGHNKFSIQAHQNAINDLENDNWSLCQGFKEDVRLTNEVIAKKLAQLPGIAPEKREELTQLSREFALRCQIKSFIKDCYLQRLQLHYLALADGTNDVDWQWLLYKPAENSSRKNLLESCDVIAHRIFWNDEIARQTADNIIKKLADNNWAKLAGYQGVGSAEGYFKKVFHTQAQDFFKALYGSCQPKTWIRNAGVVMVKLFKKLCCEKVSPTILREHFESLQNELRDLEPQEEALLEQNLSKDKIEACIRLILQKELNCQKAKFTEINDSSTILEGSENSFLDSQGGVKFEDRADISSWQGTLIALQIMIGQLTSEQALDQLKLQSMDSSNPLYETVNTLLEVLDQLDDSTLAKLQLTTNEKLVMQQRFIHKLSRKDVASQLTIQLNKKYETHQVRYDEEKAFAKLKKILEINK
ncbi:MAG: hypothetical protein ACJAW1_003488 [Glaciecola sp.]|jgi:hypothetical protein